MITRLSFVLGASLALSLLAALVIGRATPARPPLIPAQKTSAGPIVDRWPVREVRTIPITPPKAKPTPIPEEAAKPRHASPQRASDRPKAERASREPVASNRVPRTDICRGKGKRYTNNGRSWRCKR